MLTSAFQREEISLTSRLPTRTNTEHMWIQPPESQNVQGFSAK